MHDGADRSVARLDYQSIHDMIQSIIDFKYSQSHIMSDGILKMILAELEYWHDYALELEER